MFRLKSRSIKKLCFVLLIGSIALGGSACAAKYSVYTTNLQAKRVLADAHKLMKAGKLEEAAYLLHHIQKLHPKDPLVMKALAKLSQKQKQAVLSSTWLGTQKSQRVKVKATILARVLWYIPDRIVDIFDTFSLGVGVGYGVGGSVWATRALQYSFIGGAFAEGGWFSKRQLGGQFISLGEFGIGPVGLSAVNIERGGTARSIKVDEAINLHTPGKLTYQKARDYWGIGGRGFALIISVYAELHPLEVFDLLAGLFFFDPMNDDFATTRSLELTDAQNKNLNGFLTAYGLLGIDGLEEYSRRYKSLPPPASLVKKAPAVK